MKGRKEVKSIAAAHPTGSLVLVEMLTPQEELDTVLTVTEKVKNSPPQGYVLEAGPAFSEESWGFGIGDRVLLQGNYVPVPRIEGWKRDLGLVEPHSVKCVLEEADEQ